MAPRTEDAARLTSLGLHPVWLVRPILGNPKSGKKPSAGEGWQLRPWSPEPPECPGGDANLGVQTGHVAGAPVCVVVADCDSPEALTWAVEHLPPTPVRTRTGKGEHWFYRRPDSAPGTVGGKVKLTLADGSRLDFDVKGDGGQVVAAPSVHFSGHVYTECEPWTPEALAAMPVWDPVWVGLHPKRKPQAALDADSGDEVQRPGLPQATIRGRVEWALKHTRTWGGGIDAPRALRALRAAQDGQPYASPGERGATLRDLCWVLAAMCPEARTSELVEYLRPTVEASLAPDESPDTPDVGLAAAAGKVESARRKRIPEDRDAIAGMKAGLIRVDQPPAPLSPVLIVAHPRTDTVWVRKPDGTYRDAWKANHAFTYRDHPEGLKWAADAGIASWWTVNGQGNPAPKSQGRVLEEYSTPLDPARYRMSLMADANTFDVSTGAFTEACAPLRRDITPSWDAGVDAWLKVLAGPEYQRLVDWLSSVPKVDKPTPILAVIGKKGAGKGLLIDGLSRLWHKSRAPSFSSITGGFNEAVAQSPLLIADEYLPDEGPGGVDVFEYLREFVTARSHTVNRKHLPLVTVEGCLRLVYASNKSDGLNFRNANPDAKAALAERFVHIQPGQDAADHVAALSDDVKASWVQGDIIAAHVLWLHENHRVQYRGRLLVEGNGGELIDTASNAKGVSGHLCEALARVLLDPNVIRTSARDFVLVGDGELWAATRVFEDKTAWEALVPSLEGRCYSTAALGAALGMLALESGRKRYKGQKSGKAIQAVLHRVDVSQVYAYAKRTGMGDVDVMRHVLKHGNPPAPDMDPDPDPPRGTSIPHDPQPSPGGPPASHNPAPCASGPSPAPAGPVPDGPAPGANPDDAGRCAGVDGTRGVGTPLDEPVNEEAPAAQEAFQLALEPPAQAPAKRKRLSPEERKARDEEAARLKEAKRLEREALAAARKAAKRPKWEQDHPPRDPALYDPPATPDGPGSPLPILRAAGLATADSVRVTMRPLLLEAQGGDPLRFQRLVNVQRAMTRALDDGTLEDALEAAERAWMDQDGADHLTAPAGGIR